ncbi:MAG TPA: acetoacetate--CoA ligase [Gemmatimonadaceae bacterium]
MSDSIWTPSPERVERANLTRFIHEVRPDAKSYRDLWDWSVAHPEEFWPKVWRFGGVIADERPGHPPWDEVVRGLDRMAPPDPERGPRWFLGARLNFAENLLRYSDNHDAIVAWSERGKQRTMSYAELRRDVAKCAAALGEMGVGVGDRVAAFIPNIPEAVVAMLATTSLGAVWSSCSPDFGVQGVLDRFGQIEPKILFATDRYVYAGKEIQLGERVREVVKRIPSISQVVGIPYEGGSARLSDVRAAGRWEDVVAPRREREPAFVRMPFDHPVYILYSSGTTGLPKCLVHGGGGTLIQHLKELVLHTDLHREDRVLYFTTCGWMMWNWLMSVLAVGSTVVLWDGAPFAPQNDSLWAMTANEKLTVFGTSAKYLAMCEKHDLTPRATHDLSALRTILSTGSPLALHSYDYVYSRIKNDVHLSSISGGTDIVSCFAGGVPTEPVYRGELQARALAMSVDVFGDNGQPLVGEPGELVCTKPFPSMPVSFWNDADSTKYRAAYFDYFPNVWRHGDWAEITQHNGMIIYGRSDATLNPAGVRIGTAEIYRQVETLPEVVESVAIGQEIGNGDTGDVRIVLFVRLRDGEQLDASLEDRIRARIRDNTSPLHVPKKIVQVADIPRTVSGKISEIAVRDVVHGRRVKNTEALANPESLKLYEGLTELND